MDAAKTSVNVLAEPENVCCLRCMGRDVDTIQFAVGLPVFVVSSST